MEPVRLVSYNVGKLGMEPGHTRLGETPEAAETVQAVVDTLREVDGDVLALQEVPSREALDELGERAGYAYRSFTETNDPKGHHLGTLSRHPITEEQSNRERVFNWGQRFVRDVAETQVQVGPWPLRMYNAHAKADPYYLLPHTEADMEKARAKRGAETREMAAILAEDLPAMPSRRYAVAGDLNAAPETPEVQTLTALLADPLAAASGPASWSHPATERRRDYVMVSPEMASGVASAHVHRSESALRASDHLPVVLAVDLEGA